MNKMSYKNYAARIEYDDEDNLFIGHLVGINDIVGFHGISVNELESAFHEAVDDYLQACEKLGQSPDKPASGQMMLRIPPQTHAAALRSAELEGISLNKWAAKVIEEAAHQ